MKIFIKESWQLIGDIYPIAEYVILKLSGDDERGELESLAESIDNQHKAFGRLIELLASRGKLSAGEITRILEDYTPSECSLLSD